MTSMFLYWPDRGDDGKWMSSYRQHAFTTGRRHNHVTTALTKTRPKGGSQTLKQPGKLNLKEFSVVTDAIAKMNLGGKETTVSKLSKAGYGHAPLATPENVDLGSEYAQVKDAVANLYPPYDGEYSYTAVHDALASKTKTRHRREKGRPFHSDTPSDISDGSEADSSATTPRQKLHKRSLKLKKRPPGIAPPIPVPPELRSYSGQLSADNPESIFSSAKMKMEYGLLHDDDSSLDVSSPRDLNSPMGGGALKPKDGDKTARRKEKQKAKADEKQEKRRLKEEKLKKLAEKEKEREKKKSKQKVGPVPHQPTLEDFVQSETNPIPLLLERCVTFIEEEGLDSEGIYRVPGNRAHVDLLFQKFEEDPNLTIRDLDIPVNAVATALKDFFSKRLPPLLTQDMMAELEDISGMLFSTPSGTTQATPPGMILSQPFVAGARRVHKQGSTAYLNLEVITDRSCRLLHLRGLIKRLPTVNFEVLKFVFQHFVKVSENCKLNSMDSKNLAICWWPTLLPIEFSDMGRFEQMRPHLEDIVQTMIDQYPFLFCGKEAFVMV